MAPIDICACGVQINFSEGRWWHDMPPKYGCEEPLPILLGMCARRGTLGHDFREPIKRFPLPSWAVLKRCACGAVGVR